MKMPALALLCLLFAGPLNAGSLRCGSQLVSTGDSIQEVADKCGEPVSRDFLGYRERLDEWGFRQEVMVEEWVYGPRNGMYQFLRFEGNHLIDIDSQRKR